MTPKMDQAISPVLVDAQQVLSIVKDSWELEPWYEIVHRYIFIKPLCSAKRVLDLAAGTGNGCNLLADHAELVIGIEPDTKVIACNRTRNQQQNLSFLKASPLNIPLKEKEPFDLIVGFDVLDYMPDSSRLFDEVSRLLSDNGLFVISVLNKSRYVPKTGFEVPHRENSIPLNELRTALLSHFTHIKIFSQEKIAGSSIHPVQMDIPTPKQEFFIKVNAGKVTASEDNPNNPFYFIILASNSEIPDLHSSQCNYFLNNIGRNSENIKAEDPEKTHLKQIIHFLSLDLIHLYRYSVLENNQIERLNNQINELQSTIAHSFNKFLDRRFPEMTTGRILIRTLSRIMRKQDTMIWKIPFLTLPGMQFSISPPNSLRVKNVVNAEKGNQYENPPTFSLILDGDNAGQISVTRTIASVSAQTYPHWELLIINRQHHEYSLNQDPRIKRIFHDDGLSLSAVMPSSFSGNYIGFVGAGDAILPESLQEIAEYIKKSPETDILYTDESRIDEDGTTLAEIYRPDYSEDFFLSSGYISRLVMVKKELLQWESIPSLDPVYLPMIFLHAKKVSHIPKPLYRSWKNPEWKIKERIEVVSRYLAEKGIPAEVIRTKYKGVLRIKRTIIGEPKISIIIPTRDQIPLLKRCIDSIENRSTYRNYEIIIVNNQSCTPESIEYFRAFEAKGPGYRVIPYSNEFHYSSINNFAAGFAKGDHFLFLNNDIEVITPGWIEALLEHSQRPDVACVGAKLLYPDGTIQHAGVVIGLFGGADHIGKYLSGKSAGYLNAFVSTRDYSAVTSACMMISKDKFQILGGYDEAFLIGFGDTDLCLRAIEKGYRNIFTPHAQLYHFESATRGHSPGMDPHPGDTLILQHRWRMYIEYGDPYYSPNLPLDSLKGYPCLPR